MHSSLVCSLGDLKAHLLPERALWLPELNTVLVADIHFGKAASFRKLGVPVPHGTTDTNLAVLDAVIGRLGARRLVVLGDFLHSRWVQEAPQTLDAIRHWRLRRPELALSLVRGNHDDRAGDPDSSLHIHCVDEPWPLPGSNLVACHHPQTVPGHVVLAGHLHPSVTVGRSFDRLRAPCFHRHVDDEGHEVWVLPAFGAFTGTYPIERGPRDCVYAIAGDRVVEV